MEQGDCKRGKIWAASATAGKGRRGQIERAKTENDRKTRDDGTTTHKTVKLAKGLPKVHNPPVPSRQPV